MLALLFLYSHREDRPKLPFGGYGGVILNEFFDQEYIEVFRMRRDNIQALIDEIAPHYKEDEGSSVGVNF